MTLRNLANFVLALLSINCLHTRVNAQNARDPVVAIEPQYKERPELEFPKEALGAVVTGKVRVKILLGKDGVPVKTEILDREPEMAFLFDEDARRWGMKCRFTPAQDSSGKPVSVWVMVPINFKIRNHEPAMCIQLAESEYPQEALEMGMEGWVGLAVYVKRDRTIDKHFTTILAREPQNSSVFDEAAKDVAYRSRYEPAYDEAGRTSGWCFLKVPFTIK